MSHIAQCAQKRLFHTLIPIKWGKKSSSLHQQHSSNVSGSMTTPKRFLRASLSNDTKSNPLSACSVCAESECYSGSNREVLRRILVMALCMTATVPALMSAGLSSLALVCLGNHTEGVFGLLPPWKTLFGGATSCFLSSRPRLSELQDLTVKSKTGVQKPADAACPPANCLMWLC